MALTGDAKRAYQRELMRRRRGTVLPAKPAETRPPKPKPEFEHKKISEGRCPCCGAMFVLVGRVHRCNSA